MPANIDSLFSVRETPWHGEGVILAEPPSSVDDALEKAGLTWQVDKYPIFTEVEIPTPFEGIEPIVSKIEVPGQVATVRSDTGAVLGVVGENYKVVQNREALSFLDDLIGSDLHFETAGALDGGRHVWALARVPEFVDVGGDPTGIYVFVATGHDGSLAVTSSVTPVRIVCKNTLGAAIAGAKRIVRLKHTSGLDLGLRYQEAREVLGVTVNYAERFKALGDQLALEPFSTGDFEKLTAELFPVDPDASKRTKTIRTDAQTACREIFVGKGPAGDTTGNAPGTKWTAYNAVGEYADWVQRRTATTTQVDRSFGDSPLKDKALALLTD